MKIGINLTDYIRGTVGGIRSYLITIVKDFPIVSPKDTFYVICRPEGKEDFTFPGINIITVTNDFQNENLSNKLLEIIKSKKLDIWFSPLLILDPLNCPIPSVFLIPDMQHEKYPQNFSNEVLNWRKTKIEQSSISTDHIITISKFSKKEITKYLNVDSNKVSVTYLSTPYWHDIPFNKKINQEVINKYQLKPKKYFFFPANTWPHKNFKRLLNAFAKISNKYPSIDLLLAVQSNNIDPDLKKIIEKHNLNKRIRFIGFVEDKHISYIFKNSLAVVIPSLYEGFGIPAIEAMKQGVPVLCSNTTSLPEIFEDAALYFNPNSTEKIARSLVKIINNIKLRNILIKKGKKRVKEFNFRKTTKKTLSILHKVYKKKRVFNSLFFQI